MRRWERLVSFIADTYPGVFPPDDWIFGGKKHGWGLRFRKSKALLTLVPERGRVLAVIVFNGKEREAMGPILGEFEPIVRGLYENAHTYHDGTWLAITVGGHDRL